MKSKIKPFVIGILIPVGVGILSALLTMGSMDIYSDINTPALAPPGILFPIVWTVLYILMGVSSTLVYTSDASQADKNRALIVYGLQLVFNFFWSILFFNKRVFLFSFIWLVVLWLLIIAMIVTFRKVNKTAAWLQVPYLIWVIFAGYLNFAIWVLN